MNSLRARLSLGLVLLIVSTVSGAAATEASLDGGFDRYWSARTSAEQSAAVAGILATGADFDQIHRRLRAGRPYSNTVPTGEIELSHRIDNGTLHRFRLAIPTSYDPARRYPVRFYLHGGVQRPRWKAGDRWWRWAGFASEAHIAVFPSAWKQSMWWTHRQVQNLDAILLTIKQQYNIDENRVYLIGLSDGATGAWFHALRKPTPWAAFLPFIGHPGVLDNRALGVDGQIYPRNARDRDFLVINGGQDWLYPLKYVVPYLSLMQRAGARIEFRPQPESGHDLRWWRKEAGHIEAFIAARVRDPLPDRLTWETESTDRYPRNAWLLIEGLASRDGDPKMDAFADLERWPTLGFEPDEKSDQGVRVLKVSRGSVARHAGLRPGDRVISVNGQRTPTLAELETAMGQPQWGDRYQAEIVRDQRRLPVSFVFPDQVPADQATPAFRHRRPSGRIEAERVGNHFTVRCEGVGSYRLLLSADQIDFSQPVVVTTNGIESRRGMVERDAEVLLKWAARDQDREMLFAAELLIQR